MMMKRDNERIAAEHRPLVEQFVRLAEEGVLAAYVSALKRFAADRGVPCFDAYAMWEEMEADGVDIHSRLSNGINHPDAEFHEQLGNRLADWIAGG